MNDLASLIRTIPDFPKPGINFKDITTLIEHPEGYRKTIEALRDRYFGKGIDKVAGIEARGFIFGAALAHSIGAGFVPVRKKGKLPGEVVGQDYDLEYGTDRIEIHVTSIVPGDRVLVVDDLIATGGTAEAAIRLIRNKRLAGQVAGACFIVDLPKLGGAKRIEALNVDVFSLFAFED